MPNDNSKQNTNPASDPQGIAGNIPVSDTPNLSVPPVPIPSDTQVPNPTNPSAIPSGQVAQDPFLGNTSESLLTPPSIPSQQVSDMPGDNQILNQGPTSKSHVPQKYGGGKVIATIFSVLFIVGAVVAGVYSVNREQLRSSFAWDCKSYSFEVTQSGTVRAINGSTRNEPAQQVKVYINGSMVATLDVPSLPSGQSATLGTVQVPQGGFSWRATGVTDCENSGTYQVQNTPTPTMTPTPAPTLTTALTPTPTKALTATVTPIVTSTLSPTGSTTATASCNEVKAYDSEGNLLTQSELSKLTVGSEVRFAVSGQTNSGSFTKARFSVNGTSIGETTTTNSSGEYYIDYTIPVGIQTFSVKGEVFHSTLGWI